MANATSYQEHAVDSTDTVDPPAGGSRYTTLATWWAAEKGETTIGPVDLVQEEPSLRDVPS